MEEKKPAVIFDIDGTLAHGYERIKRFGKKAMYMEDEAYDDELDQHVFQILQLVSKKFHVIICSGRKDKHRDVTEKWLSDNGIQYNDLFMRSFDDNRKDSVIKREIYENNIEPFYDVFVVFDDRQQVVDMWRNELGLKCFQVQPGDF